MNYLSACYASILAIMVALAPMSAAYSAESVIDADVTQLIDFKVDINTASSEEMATLLKGIGTKKAQAIVEYREQHGPFDKVDDIVNVKGIGPSFLANNGEHLSIE